MSQNHARFFRCSVGRHSSDYCGTASATDDSFACRLKGFAIAFLMMDGPYLGGHEGEQKGAGPHEPAAGRCTADDWAHGRRCSSDRGVLITLGRFETSLLVSMPFPKSLSDQVSSRKRRYCRPRFTERLCRERLVAEDCVAVTLCPSPVMSYCQRCQEPHHAL